MCDELTPGNEPSLFFIWIGVAIGGVLLLNASLRRKVARWVATLPRGAPWKNAKVIVQRPPVSTWSVVGEKEYEEPSHNPETLKCRWNCSVIKSMMTRSRSLSEKRTERRCWDYSLPDKFYFMRVWSQPYRVRSQFIHSNFLFLSIGPQRNLAD